MPAAGSTPSTYIYPRTIIGTSGLYFDDRAVADYRFVYLEVCRCSSPSSSHGLMTEWLESPASLPSCLEITPLISQSKCKVTASNVLGEDTTLYQTCPPNFQAPVWGSCHVESRDVLTSPRPQLEEIRTQPTQATGLYPEQTPYWHAMWLAREPNPA